MAEMDKITYFTEGLLQPLNMERMPETLIRAEEVARTFDSISQRETSSKENNQIERLIEAIDISHRVPALATGTSTCLLIQGRSQEFLRGVHTSPNAPALPPPPLAQCPQRRGNRNPKRLHCADA